MYILSRQWDRREEVKMSVRVRGPLTESFRRGLRSYESLLLQTRLRAVEYVRSESTPLSPFSRICGRCRRR